MDEKKSRIGFRIAITAGFLILVVSTGVLLHNGAEPSAGNSSSSPSSSAISEEENDQSTEADKAKQNQELQTESKEIQEPKGEVVEENVTSDTNEKAAATIEKPSAVAADDEFAVFNNTLFIGDSRTEGFRLYAGVNNAAYFCLKAMTIDEIVDGKTVTMGGQNISVYDLLENSTYEKIFISVGLNELGWNHIETFTEKYGQLVDQIKEKQPNAVIYLQAILPVSREKDASDVVHNNAQVYWYNSNIVQLAEDKGVMYINAAPAVLDADGFLLDEATTDGVHLNSEYCKKLASYLADLI